MKSDSNTWTFSAQDVRSAGVWAAETILRSRTLGEKATRVTPSQVAQKIGKARESVARSLSGFDEVSKAIHWAQHQLERSGYYHVKFQQKHPPKEMAAAGHKVQIERLRKGYWDYSSRLLP
ncbi:MAG TPA: hypothetical protein VFE98_08690 [Candidatus Bathyarchaeia archaeon]|nr:hypothetical protein [Candidatus Bathyarchaeia archaeon]